MKRNSAFAPNALTSANMLCGFIAMVKAIEGEPVTAGWLIIIAAILDGLDGQLARLMNKGSHFGMEFDSIADMVSFGVAPTVLAYTTYLHKLGVLGLIIAFTFVLTGGYRLARYNVISKPQEKRDFVGLPIPISAITVASFIHFNSYYWNEMFSEFYFLPLFLMLCLLMVSYIKYDALPKLTLKESAKNRVKLIFLIVSLVLIALKPALFFFPLCLIFITQGIVRSIMKSTKKMTPRRMKERPKAMY